MLRRSLPASSGAASMRPQAHVRRYSVVGHAAVADFEHVGIVPMAGPGVRRELVLLEADVASWNPSVSRMSPVVRQRLPPTSAPHFQTSARPYWQRL